MTDEAEFESWGRISEQRSDFEELYLKSLFDLDPCNSSFYPRIRRVLFLMVKIPVVFVYFRC